MDPKRHSSLEQRFYKEAGYLKSQCCELYEELRCTILNNTNTQLKGPTLQPTLKGSPLNRESERTDTRPFPIPADTLTPAEPFIPLFKCGRGWTLF